MSVQVLVTSCRFESERPINTRIIDQKNRGDGVKRRRHTSHFPCEVKEVGMELTSMSLKVRSLKGAWALGEIKYQSSFGWWT